MPLGIHSPQALTVHGTHTWSSSHQHLSNSKPLQGPPGSQPFHVVILFATVRILVLIILNTVINSIHPLDANHTALSQPLVTLLTPLLIRQELGFQLRASVMSLWVWMLPNSFLESASSEKVQPKPEPAVGGPCDCQAVLAL